MSKRQTTSPSVTAPDAVGLTAGAPNDSAIARRAYELFEERGREPGRDQDDWLQAERELRERPDQAAALSQLGGGAPVPAPRSRLD